MANLSVTSLISIWFVPEVLDTMRGIYNKDFTPFQANVPIFWPLDTSGFVFLGSIK